MDTYRVGSNIDAWCTKCRLVLAHTIEALAENNIKRVKCNTCQGKHQFRASLPDSAKKASLKSAKTSPTKSKSSDFSKFMKGKDLEKAQAYSFKAHYKKGDLIQHIQFGLGVVVEEKDSTKVEVLFEEGARLLVHKRSSH